MKRITIVLYLLFLAVLTMTAQPSAVQKAGSAVFTLTTFKPDGSILASTHGVFIGNGGQAVSAWTPFVGASRAVCIDANGQQHQVEAIYGANELYDVCKFRVGGATTGATLAKKNVSSGSKVWLVSYSVKKPTCKAYSIKNVETFGEQGYAYYIFEGMAPDNQASCPFVNQNGEVIGLLQHAKSGEEIHATDVRFMDAFQTKGLSINDAVLRQTTIRVALPENLDEARLTLMMAGEKNDSAIYNGYVDDFLRQFPTAIDGYSARALQQLTASNFADVDATMQEAVKNVANKDEAHSAYASMIYQKEVYMNDTTYTEWNLQKALDEANTANTIRRQPVYEHQLAQIVFSMGQYEEAYQRFMALTHSDIRNGELFYEAAQCRTHLDDNNDQVLALLDSAVMVNPDNSISAPYYLARGRLLDQAGEYRKAVQDYNKYDTLMLGRGSDEFYYIKYKAETHIRQYQQALNDIAHAIVLNRMEPTYYAEMASLQLRVNMLEDAVKTADMGIQVDPDYADPYIIKGLAQAELHLNADALQSFLKAKELGDQRADGYIEKYKLK